MVYKGPFKWPGEKWSGEKKLPRAQIFLARFDKIVPTLEEYGIFILGVVIYSVIFLGSKK